MPFLRVFALMDKVELLGLSKEAPSTLLSLFDHKGSTEKSAIWVLSVLKPPEFKENDSSGWSWRSASIMAWIMAFIWPGSADAPPSAPSPVTFCPLVSWLSIWVWCGEQRQFWEIEGPSHGPRATQPIKPDCAETAGFWQADSEKQCW